MITHSRARLSNEPDLHAADILKASPFQDLGHFVCALVRRRCAIHGHNCNLMIGPQTQLTYEVICGTLTGHSLLTDEAVRAVRQDLHDHARI
jgi:hypothetical protein